MANLTQAYSPFHPALLEKAKHVQGDYQGTKIKLKLESYFGERHPHNKLYGCYILDYMIHRFNFNISKVMSNFPEAK